MTVSFRNTFGDRLGFAAYHLPRNPLTAISVLASYLVFTVLVVLPAMRQTSVKGSILAKIIAFAFLEALLAFAILAFWSLIALLTMVSRKNKTFYCQKTLNVSDEGLFGESEYGKSQIKWKMVQKLAKTRNYIFIYLSAESAWVVPARAFTTDAEKDAFFEICKKNHNLASIGPQPALNV